jgi:hypothetical protein
MHTSHNQFWMIDGLLVIIILAYFGIAGQFFYRAWQRGTRGRAFWSLAALVIIFTFCALCGYLPRLIWMPSELLILSHFVLAIAAWTFMIFGGVLKLVDAAQDYDWREANAEAKAEKEREEHNRMIRTLAEAVGAEVSVSAARARVLSRLRQEPAPAREEPASAQPGLGHAPG